MSSATFAQDARGGGVGGNARPDYDPVGVRVGSFLLFPSVELGVGYDDNIGRASTNQTESVGFTISPELQLRSQWGQHELNLSAQSQSNLYAEDSDLNYTDYSVGVDGRLDVSSSTNIEAEASYSELNEELGTVTAPTGAADPVEYTSWDVGVQLNQRFNRLTGELEGTYGELDYDDVSNLVGGIIDNDIRDRATAEVRLRLGYDVNPGVNLFVEGAVNEVDYDQAPPVVAVNRDSDGYRVGAGATFELTTLITGEIVVGYLEQSYDSAALADVSGLAADVDVAWYVTPLTTVSLGAGSEVQQSDTTGSGGFVSQYVELGVDHELLRNVILSADGSFTNNSFEGIAREDDVVSFAVAAEYLINRNMSLKARYSYEERDSNVAGRDYDRNRIGLILRLQM
ncbi:MAG: outer membrane beta-barrel protein [Opitutaceae bacterium]|nr:outer membrane beta-barrel protein [Opitutaceae bacterium]